VDYVSGGYFVAKMAGRPANEAKEILPERLVTLSLCLTSLFPTGFGNWPWYPGELDELARDTLAALGIAPNRADELPGWLKLRPPDPASVWPYAFTSIETAREFARHFGPLAEDVWLIGAGLHADMVKVFLDEADNHISQMSEAVKQGKASAPRGEVLGYELIGDGIDEHHSPFCNSVGREMCERLHVRFNRFGLIDDLSAARKAAEWLSSGEARVEPVLWLPWLLRRYDWGPLGAGGA
jgi:hypothetical protein